METAIIVAFVENPDLALSARTESRVGEFARSIRP